MLKPLPTDHLLGSSEGRKCIMVAVTIDKLAVSYGGARVIDNQYPLTGNTKGEERHCAMLDQPAMAV